MPNSHDVITRLANEVDAEQEVKRQELALALDDVLADGDVADLVPSLERLRDTAVAAQDRFWVRWSRQQLREAQALGGAR